jgi:hypothetical protein
VRPHYGLVRGPTGGLLLLLLSFLFLLFLMLRSLIRPSRSISFARARGAPLVQYGSGKGEEWEDWGT